MVFSFRAKVTLALILSLLFVATLSDLLIYRASLDSQFEQLRKSLMSLARTCALTVDAETLGEVPLNREGTNSEAYQQIVATLRRIKLANPEIIFIYTLKPTEKTGIWEFIADPDPDPKDRRRQGPTSYPGDKYDASRFPQMLEALAGSAADRKLMVDEWGVTLSGYAPILDKNGKVAAVLGVDLLAQEVYALQKEIDRRAKLVLAAGIFISLLLGLWVSGRIAGPIRKLEEATRRISAGDLEYRVNIRGLDEIGRLGRAFNKMAGELSASRQELHEYFYRAIESLVRGLEAKDSYTRGHSDRVAGYAELTAKEMGFSLQEARMLKKVAQVHDIGKLGIDGNILNKKDRLTDEEWRVIRQHPVAGEEILRPVFLDKRLLSVVRSHHERYDGSGYPDGTNGAQTDIFAQIVGVADAYDAMTSQRAYRAAMSKEDAVAELERNSATQFNPRVVEAFLKALEKGI